MYIVAFLIGLCVVTFVNNYSQGIDEANKNSYKFDQNSSYIILVLFAIGLILEKVMKLDNFRQNYYLVLVIYVVISVMSLVIANSIRIKNIEKERDQIYQMYEILESLLKIKKEKVDFNNVPFKLEFDPVNKEQICKVTITMDNPDKFNDGAITQSAYSLNKFLPYRNWTGSADYPERTCTFIGSDLPPTMAKFPGSDFRPATFIPLGVGGNSNDEIGWNLGVDEKELGHSQFIIQGSNGEKQINTSLTPKAPQSLVVGSTGGGKAIEENQYVKVYR